MIIIVDYKIGNKGSILNMFKRIGVSAKVSDNPDEILNAEKLLLPGVGHFDAGMMHLNESGLIPILEKAVFENKTKILGICLGMQLMTKGSAEGSVPGLGWIDADTLLFKFDDPTLKVPHMGWNFVKSAKPNPLIPEDKKCRYYFVHSYFVKCNYAADIAGITSYGVDFTSSFIHENIMGVQFHPEKSHSFGMDLLTKFAEL